MALRTEIRVCAPLANSINKSIHAFFLTDRYATASASVRLLVSKVKSVTSSAPTPKLAA